MGPGALAEKVSVSVHVRRKVESVLASQPLCELRITLFQRFDDLQMVDDGARRPVALRDGGPPYGSHVEQQISRRINDGLRATQPYDFGMKRDVGVRVLVEVLVRRRVLELI